MTCSRCGNQNAPMSFACASCGAALAVHADAAAVRSTHEKSPDLALVLSLLVPGAGQLYNGDTKKGVLMFLGASVGGILTLGLMYLVMMIWSMVDAYKVANQEKTLRKKGMAPPGLSEAEV